MPNAISAVVGSSLLTRGKRTHAERHQCGRRLIPAYAGKTVVSPTGAGARAAHPCLRGENVIMAVIRGVIDGSSLLTRGKLADVLGFVARLRLIPAYAGKTSVSLFHPSPV